MPSSNDNPARAKEAEARNANIDTILVLVTDLLFVAVPFIVTAFVFGYYHKFERFWTISEWAFAAAILSGQSLTKLISGLLVGRIKMRVARVVFLITLILVFGVIPSLVLLMLNMMSTEAPGSAEQPLSVTLICLQIAWFVIAVVFYIILGGTGEYARMRNESGVAT